MGLLFFVFSSGGKTARGPLAGRKASCITFSFFSTSGGLVSSYPGRVQDNTLVVSMSPVFLHFFLVLLFCLNGGKRVEAVEFYIP